MDKDVQELITFTYEKQNKYKGCLYLHGWENRPFLSRWINISLEIYDEKIPELFPGNVLECIALFVGESKPFATYKLQKITRIQQGYSNDKICS